MIQYRLLKVSSLFLMVALPALMVALPAGGQVAVFEGLAVSMPANGECDPCDMDCDGAINAFDIEPFLNILFGGATPCDDCTGDVDGDGVVNAFDIEPFLNCLFP